MEQEINKSIEDFSKGNKDLARILALFSAQMINLFGTNLTKEFRESTDKLLKINEGLINKYDIK